MIITVGVGTQVESVTQSGKPRSETAFYCKKQLPAVRYADEFN